MTLKLRRMWIQMTSDRKRFGTLCAVLLVGLLLWARLIVVSRMPRTAIADEQSQNRTTQTEKSEKSTTPSNDGATHRSVGPTVRIELETQFQHDPFVISPRYFPRPKQFDAAEAEAGKSAPKASEESLQAQARVAQLQAQVQKLRLEAAVNGSMAVINGKTYRTGDTVTAEVAGAGNGEPVVFRLVEVKHRSAILETPALQWLGGKTRRFEISMALR